MKTSENIFEGKKYYLGRHGRGKMVDEGKRMEER